MACNSASSRCLALSWPELQALCQRCSVGNVKIGFWQRKDRHCHSVLAAAFSAPIRMQSGAERCCSRLCLLGKRLVHPDRLKRRVHPFAQHINDINTGSGIVAVIVTALTRGVIARPCTVRLAAGSAAAVGGARIGHLRWRHCNAGDGIMICRCLRWHSDGKSFLGRWSVGIMATGRGCHVECWWYGVEGYQVNCITEADLKVAATVGSVRIGRR